VAVPIGGFSTRPKHGILSNRITEPTGRVVASQPTLFIMGEL